MANLSSTFQLPSGVGKTRASRTISKAVQPASPTATTRPTASEVPTIALKEWNVAIAALGRGEQTILLRKGGIKEPVFKPAARQFLLFPTSFHSDTQLLKPGVAEQYADALRLEPKQQQRLQLGVYVEVTGAWVTEDPSVLHALDQLHIWTQAFVDARLKWRAKQPLTLLELRAWQLQPALDLQVHPDFFGCFSFVDLASGLDSGSTQLQDAIPALDDEGFAARQQLLRAQLALISHAELEL